MPDSRTQEPPEDYNLVLLPCFFSPLSRFVVFVIGDEQEVGEMRALKYGKLYCIQIEASPSCSSKLGQSDKCKRVSANAADPGRWWVTMRTAMLRTLAQSVDPPSS